MSTENDDIKAEVDLGETASDIEPGLPVNNLHITISRIKEQDGGYTTRIWLNRKVRRFYAMGLLHEAMAMFQSNNDEVTWCDDTPGCMGEQDLGQQMREDDDLNGAST